MVNVRLGLAIILAIEFTNSFVIKSAIAGIIPRKTFVNRETKTKIYLFLK